MWKLVDLLKMIMHFMGDQAYSDDGESIVLVPMEAYEMIAKFNDDMVEVKDSISIVHPTAGGEENEYGDGPRTPPRPVVRAEDTVANAISRGENQLRVGEGNAEQTPQSWILMSQMTPQHQQIEAPQNGIEAMELKPEPEPGRFRDVGEIRKALIERGQWPWKGCNTEEGVKLVKVFW